MRICPFFGVPLSRFVRLLAIAVAIIGVLVTPAILFAHARLVRSDPSADGSLSKAPTSLRLWFSERPELRFTTIGLSDSAGSPVQLGAVGRIPGDAMGLSASISTPLANGRYTVSWRTAADDGHPTSGTFAFVVAVPTNGAVVLAGADTPRAATKHAIVEPPVSVTVPTAVRWADLVAVLTIVGTAVFGLFVLPGASLPPDVVRDARDRTRRLANAVLLLFVVTTVWRLAAQTSLLPSSVRGGTAMLTVLHDTSWGKGWIVGAIGIAVAALGLLMARSSRVGWALTGIGAAAIAASEGLTGHPAAATNVPLAAAVDVVHVIGAGGWIGGLAAVALCGLAATRRSEVAGGTTASHQLVRSFHRSAVVCVSIVLLTALAGAWLRLSSLSDLWTTGYGFVLLVKLLLVLVLLAFGWFHWRTAVIPDWTDDTRFRFRRSAALELVVGACIIAATAVLITTALPRS